MDDSRQADIYWEATCMRVSARSTEKGTRSAEDDSVLVASSSMSHVWCCPSIFPFILLG